MNNRFCWPTGPKANEQNIIKGDCWRFTFLTERLLRLEYDPEGLFEDRASQSIFYRDTEPVSFTRSAQGGVLTLETEYLRLTYQVNTPFSADTLSVALKTPPAATWHFGEKSETLGGTVKTLDGSDGEIPIGNGVCSRNGFAVLDDTERMLLRADGWPEPRRAGTLDLYFFGHGLDYRGAVKDLYRITGAPPLLPAYALGNWWSRYHAYTQQEYLDLMDRFEAEGVPLSVGVVDMDWHITEIPDADPTYHNHPGWTGYTWNKELFPDYKEFLKELHARGLKTALNLHPAQGVRRHEAMYQQFCRAMGKEPDGSPIHFNILDRKYMENYFDLLHHPYEEDGVDFWWMDFQQRDFWWTHSPEEVGKVPDPCPALDPLWLLNHLHILDIQKNGKRPMFFSRYSGPGSHRYPVGFSGDTYITWESLNFQPYFTATASNIGYGWWSHDIGGHMGGYREDELAIRWLQLGVFSPILRLHSNNHPGNTKEPWSYGERAEQIMKEQLRLRHRLLPYIYTMNNRTHREGVPLIQPMYYTHPQNDAAYEVKNQYWFGDQMMIAPITQRASKASGRAKVRAWLPGGIWTDLFTGTVYDGKDGRFIDLYRDDTSIPALCKAGAIIPMQGKDGMEITLCPGGDNTFTLYEDAGEGFDYREGGFVETKMDLSYGEQKTVFTLSKPCGDASLMKERCYRLCFKGYEKPDRVLLNGQEAAFTYDAKTASVWVEIGNVSAFTLELWGKRWQGNHEEQVARMRAILNSGCSDSAFKEQIQELLDRYAANEFREGRLPEYLRRNCTTPGEWEIIRAMLEFIYCDR